RVKYKCVGVYLAGVFPYSLCRPAVRPKPHCLGLSFAKACFCFVRTVGLKLDCPRE
ncbi:hypothetical protein E2562_029188, partial [Oryza meyeriana var. granulata]